MPQYKLEDIINILEISLDEKLLEGVDLSSFKLLFRDRNKPYEVIEADIINSRNTKALFFIPKESERAKIIETDLRYKDQITPDRRERVQSSEQSEQGLVVSGSF